MGTAIIASASAFTPSSNPTFSTKLSAQDFLEAEPYYDQSSVPTNTYKPKTPFAGKVVSSKRIVGPLATGETCHIIINHDGDFPYWEGQSYGVVPPGQKANGKPNAPRLYSIASTRYGDDMTGKTGSLCVRRATYWCPELKADDPEKKGICSNFLCDTVPGDEVKMTGPVGKAMLYLNLTLLLTTSWLQLELVLHHTVVLLDVCLLKIHQLPKHTKAKLGYFLE